MSLLEGSGVAGREMRPSFRAAVLLGAGLALTMLPGRPSAAWGPEAHRVVAHLAERLLQQSDPTVIAKVHALIDTDPDKPKGKATIGDEAVWPNELLEHSEEARTATTDWHYVPLNFSHPDLTRDCHDRKPLPAGYPASHGPADNCAVDKINQFAAELSNPGTSPDERLAALRFLLNLVADLHDPIYAIDHGDRHGRCIAIIPGDGESPVRLYTYWDHTLASEVIGRDPLAGAARIGAWPSAADAKRWAAGGPDQWALETYEFAKTVTYGVLATKPVEKYSFPAPPRDRDPCGPVAVYRVGPDYETKGLLAVKQQLAKAGLRLALILHDSLR